MNKIHILCWSDECERWGGNIHIVGYYSSCCEAEQAALKQEMKLSDTTPWVKVDNEWHAERHYKYMGNDITTKYVMSIEEVQV